MVKRYLSCPACNASLMAEVSEAELSKEFVRAECNRCKNIFRADFTSGQKLSQQRMVSGKKVYHSAPMVN